MSQSESFTEPASKGRSFGFGAVVLGGGLLLTATFFLVLPLLQAITQGPPQKDKGPGADVGNIPPPPPPPEEEPEQEEEPEPEPEPELTEDNQPLELSQLELALNAGGGSSWATGDFGVKLNTIGKSGKKNGALFSLADLDQKPRAVYQAQPRMSAALQKQVPATVYIVFIVDEGGRVRDPRVQKSTNSAFDNAALAAIKKWKFQPGKRGGEPVQFRMRVPITFPRR